MIGQQKLIAQIDELIANDKFPRFSIVVGERGMEHEDVARYIANQYQGADYIQLPDVKVDTVRNMIKQSYQLHHLTFFCIPHADDMSVNAKNAILKVVEETPNKAYFIMCLEDINNTLATIQSRGIVFQMYKPTQNDIADFARSLYVDKKDINEKTIEKYCDICSTPGDVLYLINHDINVFYEYVNNVADNIVSVSGAEVFKLFDKVAFKDEEDKYDCALFLKALNYTLLKKALDDLDILPSFRIRVRIPVVVSRYLQDLRIKGINKQMLVYNMALEVRKVWKSQI